MKDQISGRRSLLLGFLILCLLGLGIFGMTAFERHAHREVERTLRTEQKLSSLLAQQQAAESGRQGYFLTGQPALLRASGDAKARISRDLADLEHDLAHDELAMAAIGRMRRLSADHDILLAAILARQAGDGVIAPSATDRAKSITDQMHALILLQISAQEDQLQEQARTLRWRSYGLSVALLLINLLIIGLFILVFRIMRQRLRQAMIIQEALQSAKEEAQVEGQRREQIEARLHHLQKMEAIGRLSSAIAHDFKNMIGGVAMVLESIRAHVSPQDMTAHEDIDLALLGTSKATSLANRLLILGRQQVLHPQVVDINTVIVGITGLLYRTIGRYLTIDLVLAEDLGKVIVDPEQLETAIINLCLNARDAIPGGGRITISTCNLTLHEVETARYPEAAQGDYVAISISDTGAGMTPDVAARAFDPFYSTKDDAEGLGLSQVDGFVSQSGGHIRIFSTAGQGTTMKIILSRLADDASEPDPIKNHAIRLGGE